MTMTTKRGSAEPLAQIDALSWAATLSSSEPDCVRDRVLDWTWTGATLPVFVAHDTAALPVAGVRPYKEPGRLRGVIVFPAPGTSAASDEARRLVESGVARAVSIGFTGKGTPNELGGLDFPLAHVRETSLVGLGCNFEAAIGRSAKAAACACGKHDGSRIVLNLTRTPRYVVQPEQLVAAVREATKAAVIAAAHAAAGRLDGTPRPPRHVGWWGW